MKSMSKAYGICGLRIGYLLTANEGLAALMRDGLHIWNLNGFAEEFLRLSPGYRQDFAESCALVAEERDAFFEDLETVPGLTVLRPDANFIFCRLPDGSPSGPDITRQLFIKTMPEADRYVRIASRTGEENRALTTALKRILAEARAR